MPLPENFIDAIYRDPGLERYRGNPLIEALPPVMDLKAMKASLTGKVDFNHQDCFDKGHLRAHQISSLLDDFFQPLSIHRQLEEKISILIRAGYVGRNIADGSLNRKMQEGYKRIMSGATSDYRFSQSNSTAKSLSLIGCSGSGKSSTVNRILATYPQVIYHPKYNFIQLPYLRIECPSDGSLKSLCLNFFREVDRTLHTEYEKTYARKRHSPEVLLSLMGQVATQRAIGVLVIDEIQRLTLKRSVSKEAMLEFFVALVNVIGVPVVLVGTPKARPIFELELQAGRRSAGFGSLFWEPMQHGPTRVDPRTGMPRRTEWQAFTDKLWQYQWLTNREEVLSDAVRDCWFDLSQGVLDIVVKLFVLAQMRAISTGLERITVKLLRTVYEQELKPVHPMLDALRRGDPELITKYSDLQLPGIDKRILQLRKAIDERQAKQEPDQPFSGNETASRLHTMLQALGCESKLLQPLIENALKDYPKLSIPELSSIILDWYHKPAKPKKTKPETVKVAEWGTLPSEDLRFKFSQAQKGKLYEELTYGAELFDVPSWLKKVG
ncbi:transcriptional antiterminator [Ferrimonas sediminicola]|uniref:Transcriptional antiterminator n=1 Tax=Ferrimonas sediminicola TaxID=2569538 RepID=A0A4V5NUL9_9GAMM|nr:AAA family ATPase [Ferrimonas sediminicola]TKB47015.1 transcriptional antiterminator [Ferrimonas sediminicola]